MNLIKI